MAFSNAQKSRILLGSLHLSGYTKGFTPTYATAKLDTTSLFDTDETSIPGLKSSSHSMSLMLDTDTTTGGEVDVLGTWRGTSTPISYGPVGLAAGSRIEMVSGIQTNYTASSTASGLVMADVSSTTDGASDFGISLLDLAATTADGSSTGVDNTASSANGGVAHLHVTAFSGFTSDAIIIEHSTNNSTWATLGTFTTVTGLTSQRLVIASGTTVNRYLRVTDDVTGSGSITRFVAFCRR